MTCRRLANALMLLLVVLTAGQGVAAAGSGADRPVTWSLLGKALAPNAGGQDAYALKRESDNREWTVFANNYLLVGGWPMIGGLYSWRMSVCQTRCWWQLYAQAGLGLSTAGPLAEITWGMIPFWILRIDVTTHIILAPTRAQLWSYPLWVGVSLPL